MPTLTTIRGLNTFDSELSLPSGTLKTAKNVVVDKRNIARPRRGFNDYGTTFTDDEDRAKQLMVYKDRIFRHFDSTIEFDSDGVGTFLAFNGTYNELEEGLRIKFREANSNFYFTTADGIKKISATSPSEFSQNSGYIESAGIPKALDTKGKVVFDVSGFLPASSKVAYRVVWGKNDVNGNLLLSGVGSRLVVTNDSEDITVTEKSTIDTINSEVSILAPDAGTGAYFIITDGSNNSYYVWYNDTDVSVTKPVTSETIGKTEVEIDLTGASTSSDIAAYTGSALAQINGFNVTVNTNKITITNTSGNDVTDIRDGVVSTGFIFDVEEQGQVLTGLRSNVQLSFSIPSEIKTTDYFYQVYRTAVFTTSTGVELIDIDPGDEMNLVLESGITVDQLEYGYVGQIGGIGEVLLDDTSESFRESGAILYTNPQSGDGILQSNERPPIAHDIASFKNSMFYSNTKTAHRSTVNLLAIDQFISGTSKLIIGNSTNTREYTFTGTKQVQSFITNDDDAVQEKTEIITDTKLNTFDGQYFDINSASGNAYRVYMDTTGGNSVVPSSDGKTLVRVDINLTTTAIEVADSVASTLDSLNDFTCPSTGTDTIIVTDVIYNVVMAASNGDLGGTWNISRLVEGLDSTRDGVYFTLSSASDKVDLYVWLTNKNDNSSDPAPSGKLGIKVAYVNGDSADDTATKISEALASSPYFDSVNTTNKTKQQTQIVADTKANTNDGEYFDIDSTLGFPYRVYMDTTGGDLTVPTSDGRDLLRVDISGDTTAAEVGDSIANVLNLFTDEFSCPTTGTGTIVVTNIVYGSVDDAVNGNLGNAWSISVINAGIDTSSTVKITWATNGNVAGDITDFNTGYTINTPSIEGEGETTDTADGGNVLLSSLISIAGAIDETARSLVNVINRDSKGVVYAYYISGPDSLPGIISLESRNITDDPFYMAVNQEAIQTKFSPEMDLRKDVTNVTVAVDEITTITSTGHGYSNGDNVFIYDLDTLDPVYGKYTISNVTTDTFEIPVNVQTITSNSGFVFKAETVSDNEVKPNRLYYSKSSRPEAVPLVNFIDIGAKDKAIQRIIELRDNLYVFKEDGVYIVTGTSIPFQTRLIDSSANIIAPDSAAVLNNQIFFLSTQGVATASDSGISVISKPIENLILDATRTGFSHATSSFGVGYENDRSYLLWMPTDVDDTVATQCFRYSTHNGYWTTWELTNTCGIVNPLDDKLYLGNADLNAISQERKNGDRKDYSDRDFEITIPALAISGTNWELSSSDGIASGDVLVQTQYLTIAVFNRLLKKLDTDPGLDDTDYYATLGLSDGGNLANGMSALVTKLNTDDTSLITYSYDGDIDFQAIQTQFNVIITNLNDFDSDPDYNYNNNTSTGTVEYETIILEINRVTNDSVVAYELPVLEGPISVYTGYECIVEWAPQHFGDASAYKQISEGSILFDANNFYSAEIQFSSDRSKNFKGVEFRGKGTGVFGQFAFGETTFGGDGTDEGIRTLVPRDKQRCRYLSCRFVHKNAREEFNLLGISMKPRQYSTRAYRSGAGNE